MDATRAITDATATCSYIVGQIHLIVLRQLSFIKLLWHLLANFYPFLLIKFLPSVCLAALCTPCHSAYSLVRDPALTP